METVVYDRVKYYGEFDLKRATSIAMEWFANNGFEAHELNYTQKEEEIEIWIDAERDRSEYARDIIELRYHYWGVTPTKRDEKGNQYYVGRMLLQVWGKLELGYDDFYKSKKFDDPEKPFKKRLFDFYTKHILAKTIEFDYTDVLFYDTHKLINTIKKAYDIEFTTLRGEE